MTLFFSSSVKPDCEHLCYSVGGDYIEYSSLLADQKTKVDNFLSIFAGNVGVVSIKNCPGEGLIDISFAVQEDDGRIGVNVADYNNLPQVSQGYITDFINMITE